MITANNIDTSDATYQLLSELFSSITKEFYGLENGGGWVLRKEAVCPKTDSHIVEYEHLESGCFVRFERQGDNVEYAYIPAGERE
jgi:hypothetical protein